MTDMNAKKRVAFFRAINIGKHNRLPMKDLKTKLEQNGFKNLVTYLQSGNLLFDMPEIITNEELAERIKKIIQSSYQLDICVLVRDAAYLDKLILKNPFDINTSHNLHVTLLWESPNPEIQTETNCMSFAPDKFDILGTEVFISCSGKYHKSKLSNAFFEKQLNTIATTRNWKTILKMKDLCKCSVI